MTDDPATPAPGPLDAIVERFADTRVRTLLFAGLGAMALLFAVLFLRGSDIGGLLIGVIGAVGLVFGWRGPPVFVLLLLLYFLVFPDGLPIPPDRDVGELAYGSFRLDDLMLAACVVVYLSAQFRLHGVTTQAMPGEGGRARQPAAPVKRPADLIRRGELARLLYATGAVVIVGQIVWAVVTNVEVDVLAGFPFRFSDDPGRFYRDVGDLGMVRTRLVAVAGLLFFGMLLARLVFGYWKLRVMTPAQGAMFLMDAGWTETSRERVRVEGWRMWGVKRVADRVRAGWRPGGGKQR